MAWHECLVHHLCFVCETREVKQTYLWECRLTCNLNEDVLELCCVLLDLFFKEIELVWVFDKTFAVPSLDVMFNASNRIVCPVFSPFSELAYWLGELSFLPRWSLCSFFKHSNVLLSIWHDYVVSEPLLFSSNSTALFGHTHYVGSFAWFHELSEDIDLVVFM